MAERIVVAMSGGVDSSVAAALLPGAAFYMLYAALSKSPSLASRVT